MKQKSSIILICFILIFISICASSVDEVSKTSELMRIQNLVNSCKKIAKDYCKSSHESYESFFDCWQSNMKICVRVPNQRSGMGECVEREVPRFVEVCWRGVCVTLEMKVDQCFYYWYDWYKNLDRKCSNKG